MERHIEGWVPEGRSLPGDRCLRGSGHVASAPMGFPIGSSLRADDPGNPEVFVLCSDLLEYVAVSRQTSR